MGVEPKVIGILAENPALPYSKIACKVGVTRERVRQIARQNGYPPRREILKPRICPFCGETYYKKNQYCSRTCAYKSRKKRIAVNCCQCGKTIEKTPGNMRSRSGRYFCDRLCCREWAGKDNPATLEKNIFIIGEVQYEVGSTDRLVSAP